MQSAATLCAFDHFRSRTRTHCPCTHADTHTGRRGVGVRRGGRCGPTRTVTRWRRPRRSEVVAFWEGAGPALWFAKDDAFDRALPRALPAAARSGGARRARRLERDAGRARWRSMILLDQFPRNAFRGTPRMYATDAWRAQIATPRSPPATTVRRHRSCRCSSICRSGTRRDLADQERAVELCAPPRASPTRRMPSTTATSCGASAASRTATRSSAAPTTTGGSGVPRQRRLQRADAVVAQTPREVPQFAQLMDTTLAPGRHLAGRCSSDRPTKGRSRPK